MNYLSRIARRILVFCLALAAVFALAGCMAPNAQQEPVASDAAQNRAYMATLNRQMADLQETMTAFEEAVAKDDTVTMQAKLGEVNRIIDSVKNTAPTERLSSVKDGYVDAICTLGDAMSAYVVLYNDAKNGKVDSTTYESRLSEVQDAYDAGIEKMKAADQAVENISHE